MTLNNIYDAHKKLGFPKLSHQEQLTVIFEMDYSIIMNICPQYIGQAMPTALLREYLFVSKEDVKEFLVKNNHIKKELEKFSDTQDGPWLRKVADGYEMVHRDRGKIEYIHHLKSDEEVLDEYVKSFMFYLG